MKKILLLMILIVEVFALDATMEIIKRKVNLPNISVNISKESSNNYLATKIKSLIKKDLEVSGHFNVKEFLNEQNINDIPNYLLLEKADIDLIGNIHIENMESGSIILKVKVYDVNTKNVILDKVFSSSKSQRYPFVSHKVAIEINKALNAPSIGWMDKFIIFARYLNSKESQIVVSDYTLTYQKVIVSGGLNIFPKWADKNQENFYYTSYSGVIPKLIKQNLYTGKKSVIDESDGMIVCSDISYNSPKIVLTMAPNSQPDIYVYDLEKKYKTRITKFSGIDVGGSFVENDKKIVFVSDRLRTPNIFAKTIGQKGVERLVYHGKNNSQCTTHNNYIVYSSRESDNEFGRNAFNLYIISTESDFVRRLTTTGRNQFPKFSPDGDSILFIKHHKNKSYLGIIRLNYNKSFLFPLENGKFQSIDW
jgi:TolB protein